jgi:hypothetical protein
MQKSYLQAFSTPAWYLIDQADPLVTGLLQGFTHILHSKSQVMDTRSLLLKEFADGTFRIGTLEQLDLGITHPEESGADFLVAHLLNSVTLKSKHFFVIGNGLGETGDCNPNVFNMCWFHGNKEYLMKLSKATSS